jgi:predicted RNase H-like HicB family nuclease
MTEAEYPDVTPEELAEARRYVMEIAWSPEDEVFVVSFPDAPGVLTHGRTRAEAAAQGEDAMITWLTALRDAGRRIPPPRYRPHWDRAESEAPVLTQSA